MEKDSGNFNAPTNLQDDKLGDVLVILIGVSIDMGELAPICTGCYKWFDGRFVCE